MFGRGGISDVRMQGLFPGVTSISGSSRPPKIASEKCAGGHAKRPFRESLSHFARDITAGLTSR